MSSTVRISENGRRVLAELASETDSNMTAILDEALENYRRQRLLAKAAAAYQALAEDSSADAGYRAELTDLDAACSDGLDSYAP